MLLTFSSWWLDFSSILVFCLISYVAAFLLWVWIQFILFVSPSMSLVTFTSKLLKSLSGVLPISVSLGSVAEELCSFSVLHFALLTWIPLRCSWGPSFWAACSWRLSILMEGRGTASGWRFHFPSPQGRCVQLSSPRCVPHISSQLWLLFHCLCQLPRLPLPSFWNRVYCFLALTLSGHMRAVPSPHNTWKKK